MEILVPFALGIFDEGTFLNDNKRIKRLLMDCQISVPQKA